ncbi:MAG: lecithin retinol acyltransferase family protein [Planctomycetales bacterium]|nr:lecithin retinol acyltransferase family protein [Planctomycetales bacterium]
MIWHYGIYVGPRGPHGEDVVHNTKGENVGWATLLEFTAAQPYFIEQHAPSGYEEAVVSAAINLIGTPYNLLNFNCEQFASLVQSGRAESRQLDMAKGVLAVGASVVGLAAVAGLAGLAARDASRCRGTTGDGSRCRRRPSPGSGYCWQHQA